MHRREPSSARRALKWVRLACVCAPVVSSPLAAHAFEGRGKVSLGTEGARLGVISSSASESAGEAP